MVRMFFSPIAADRSPVGAFGGDRAPKDPCEQSLYAGLTPRQSLFETRRNIEVRLSSALCPPHGLSGLQSLCFTQPAELGVLSPAQPLPWRLLVPSWPQWALQDNPIAGRCQDRNLHVASESKKVKRGEWGFLSLIGFRQFPVGFGGAFLHE